MLKDDYTPELTPLDYQVFSQLVPEDHYLRRLKAAVDFSQLRPLLADCYSAEMGRGALDPVCLLKLLLFQVNVVGDPVDLETDDADQSDTHQRDDPPDAPPAGEREANDLPDARPGKLQGSLKSPTPTLRRVFLT